MRGYIEAAKKAAGQKHLNFIDDPKMGFVQQPGSLYATGAAGSGSEVKKSQPYVVNITSTSGANVTDFDILGTSEYVNNAGFTAAGSLVIGSITISSGIPGVNYREFLYQCQNNPFTVGQTYIRCDNAAAQVQEPFSVITKDSNGTALTIPMVPNLDPYQQIQSVMVVDQQYRVDGFTKLRFSTILANAVISVRLFPADNINPARALAGQPTGRAFGNPGIIRR